MVAHSCLINCFFLSVLLPLQRPHHGNISSWKQTIGKDEYVQICFILSTCFVDILWMFCGDKSLRHCMCGLLMLIKLCLWSLTIIKTVFISVPRLTWTNDKHFAFSPLLNCTVLCWATATHWGQLGCQQSQEVHSRCFCHYLLKSNLRGPLQQLVKLPLI